MFFHFLMHFYIILNNYAQLEDNTSSLITFLNGLSLYSIWESLKILIRMKMLCNFYFKRDLKVNNINLVMIDKTTIKSNEGFSGDA